MRVIRATARGDERALRELYDGFADRVFGSAVRMLRDEDEAEEVVEETFWQVWLTAGDYDPARGSPSAWIAAISRSRTLDRIRAVGRRREQPLDPLPDPPWDGDLAPKPSDPSSDLEASERRRVLLEALDELPAQQRDAVMLAYFSGYSQSEVANRMGAPLGTVKTRVRLALAKLRERLVRLDGGADWMV
ncbi:MAG: sigma-70 family RNA polymerase sigma factor [Longimicrobiaceae bacterium]